MKKQIIVLGMLLMSLAGHSQTKDSVVSVKKDTTIQLLIPLAQFRALLYTIDQNVDSKKTSKELLEFLQRSAMIYQPEEKKAAQKPKQ